MEQAIVIGSIARRVLDGVRFGRVAEIFERKNARSDEAVQDQKVRVR